MSFNTKTTPEKNTESSLLLLPTTTTAAAVTTNKIPNDPFHLTYIIYFTLGLGYLLLPWNAFITAVDYFTYLYPDVSVDRVFSLTYMVAGLVVVLLIVFYAQQSAAHLRINIGLGLGLFVVSLLIVPVMDLVYIQGRVRFFHKSTPPPLIVTHVSWALPDSRAKDQANFARAKERAKKSG